MANITKSVLQQENEKLSEEREALLNQQVTLEARIAKMEDLVEQKRSAGEYKGPEPVLYNDPFDLETNPHHIKKQPPGKVLGWKNPHFRNNSGRGWRGWEPVTYDSEIGQDLEEYINSPPMKMAGAAEQDNYVRRGTDSILCVLDKEIWLARQQKREQKALRKQEAATFNQNRVLRPGVSTTGDGVRKEERPPGGFRVREKAPDIEGHHPSHRTEMFDNKE